MANNTFTEMALPAKTVGEMLSLSKRQIFRLNSCGKIPKPIRIGGSVRWRLSDIKLFLQCNGDMVEFNAQKVKEEGV
jgi:predicted DNA-binding transcriptional regulator AlpA